MQTPHGLEFMSVDNLHIMYIQTKHAKLGECDVTCEVRF